MAGKPAMTGEWSGPMALANGVNGTLMLTLEDTFDNQEDWFGLNIDGSAHYCLGGIAGDFVVYGKADRQGNIGDLRFYSPVDDPILLLHMMSSRWQGDALELSGTYSYDLSAVHLSRSDVPEPPISFRLGRTKIDTECAETVP